MTQKGHQVNKLLRMNVWLQLMNVKLTEEMSVLKEKLFLITLRVPLDEVLQLCQVLHVGHTAAKGQAS